MISQHLQSLDHPAFDLFHFQATLFASIIWFFSFFQQILKCSFASDMLTCVYKCVVSSPFIFINLSCFPCVDPFRFFRGRGGEWPRWLLCVQEEGWLSVLRCECPPVTPGSIFSANNSSRLARLAVSLPLCWTKQCNTNTLRLPVSYLLPYILICDVSLCFHIEHNI